mmetsp:Transcript_39721/g.113429  ORF Transcript_39721/g.113429 Transcript_39721/m.113429 type:complete len:248 (+) Transcript_39721:328-1071(+)
MAPACSAPRFSPVAEGLATPGASGAAACSRARSADAMRARTLGGARAGFSPLLLDVAGVAGSAPARGAARRPRPGGSWRVVRGELLPVDPLPQLHQLEAQVADRVPQAAIVRGSLLLGGNLLKRREPWQERLPRLLGNLAAQVVEVLLGLLQEALRRVPQLQPLLALFVTQPARLCVLEHLVNLMLVHVLGTSDPDSMLTAGCPVLCRYREDAVPVDFEGDLDLWHAHWRRGNALQAEGPQALVVRS